MYAPWLTAIIIAATSYQMMDMGTLVPVGVSNTAITIAADSAISNPGQPIQIMRGKKIFPVGKFGACAFLGSAGIRERIGSTVLDETRVRPIADKWLKAHPDANIRAAYTSIDAEVLVALKEFHHRHPELDWKTEGRPHDSNKRSFVSLFCIGYDMGIPVGFLSDYIAPSTATGEFTKDPLELPLTPGFFGPFGQSAVCLELMNGTSKKLATFTDRAAVRKYRTAYAAKRVHELGTDDLIALSEVCLQATESLEGKAFDSHAYQVAAPNRYAVIDSKQGFRWIK